MSINNGPEPEALPPPPPSSPETPSAIENALSPLLDRFADRIVERVTDRALETLDRMMKASAADTAKLMAAIDMVDQKGASRHKLLVNRLTTMERKLRALEQRVNALETTRIVLRSTLRSAALAKKKRKRAAR